MLAKLRKPLLAVLIVGLSSASSAWAAETGDAAKAAEAGDAAKAEDAEATKRAMIEANTEEVREILKRSADFLAAQKQFAFKAETSFDVLQSNGQMLTFFERRDALVRRPDRLRVEVDEADGDSRTLRFDGKQVSIDSPADKAYVLLDKPGDTDQLISYFVDDLGIPVPLNNLYGANFYTQVSAALISGFYVEEVGFGKLRCDHVAFRLKDVDVELWVETGDRPLPCMLAITYNRAAGHPQYRARFVEWDLSPSAPDGAFAFTPPAGAERLSVQTAAREIRQDKELE